VVIRGDTFVFNASFLLGSDRNGSSSSARGDAGFRCAQDPVDELQTTRCRERGLRPVAHKRDEAS
jgi:hypothetical protein